MSDPMISSVSARWREDAITWSNDERRAKQFHFKREAMAAARVTGGMPTAIDVMGFTLWAIVDDSGLYITNTGYALATSGHPHRPPSRPDPTD